MTHFASLYPKRPLPSHIAKLGAEVRSALDMPVAFFIQQSRDELGEVSHDVYEAFLAMLQDTPRNQPIAVIIQSPGGDAHSAYKIACALRRHCGGFVAVIPRYAKSAATLLSLGADRIILGEHAELGPLDAQIEDSDREQTLSALEVVQSIERLNSEAMQAVDAQMFNWMIRSRKKTAVLLPIATKFVAEMMRPLFDKVDTVEFTTFARILKVGQDYAARLLLRQYPEQQAEHIAASLTKNYPDHGFVIDADECERRGLTVELPPKELLATLNPFAIRPKDGTILGLFREQSDEAKNPKPAAVPTATSEASSRPRSGSGAGNRTRQGARKQDTVESGNGSPATPTS